MEDKPVISLNSRDVPLSTETVGGVTELAPGMDGSSGPRVQMQGTHYAQAPCIVGAEPALLFTGSEFAYAETTFNIKVTEDCVVKKLIQRYAYFGVGDPIETYVFIEYLEGVYKGHLGVIHIPRYKCDHQYFGYDYVLTERGENLREGIRLRAGEVLADSPNVKDGEYCLGVNARVAIASHPQCIEDAVLVRQSFADKMMSYGYYTAAMNVASDEYMLYPHTDFNGERLIVPHIGGIVGSDGVLLAKRRYDPLLAGIEMAEEEINTVCGHYDDVIYVDPGSEIIDIKVWQGNNRYKEQDKPQIPPVDPLNAFNTMYDELASYYQSVRNKYKLKLHPEVKILLNNVNGLRPRHMLNAGLIERQDIVNNVHFSYEPYDEFRIEVTVKYKIPFDISSKITDRCGGKGIVGKVVPDAEFPIGEYGTEIDMFIPENSIFRRTNFNRLNEININSASMEVQRNIRKRLNDEDQQSLIDYVMGYFKGIASMWYEAIEQSHPTNKEKMELIRELADNVPRINLRHERPETLEDINRFIERNYTPLEERIWITNPLTNKQELTIEKFRIGYLYVIRLDKTGRDASAISACKFQHFGTAAKLHSKDKHARPMRENAIRYMSEADSRHQGAYGKDGILAENMDRANNPIVQDAMTETILLADNPLKIRSLVDRNKYKLGRHSAMALVQHVLATGGVKFTKR